MKKLLTSFLIIATLTGCASTYAETGTQTDYSAKSSAYSQQYATSSSSAVNNDQKSYSKPAPVHYYENVDGNRVQSPTYYSTAPADASALCRDGTYSRSQHRRGTCSHHGGVEEWR